MALKAGNATDINYLDLRKALMQCLIRVVVQALVSGDHWSTLVMVLGLPSQLTTLVDYDGSNSLSDRGKCYWLLK